MTASTKEGHFGAPKQKMDYGADLAQSDAEFTLTPSVPIASELMFLANEAGNAELTQKAANFILGAKDSIQANSLIQFAQRAAGFPAMEAQPSPKAGQPFLKEARQLLSLEYRNPILLVDVARELTSMGHHQSALRYVKAAIAIDLAPVFQTP